MISIIIPVYNVSLYLDECVKSILGQTYMDYECILVDDGSTDDSLKKCHLWACKDSRIRVIHQNNQGVSAARNKGIEEANGEYITFIDSDDWVDSSYLEDMMMPMLQKSVDLVVSGLKQRYKDGSFLYFNTKEMQINISEQYVREFVEINQKFLLYGPVAKLYKTYIIRKFSIKFPLQCSYGEDLIFNYCYLEYVRSLYVVSQSNYNYRIVGFGTLSSIKRENQFHIEYEQWIFLRKFYQTHNMLNEESRKYLYDRLWWSWYDTIFAIPKVMKNKSFFDKLQFLKQIMNINEKGELLIYSKSLSIPVWFRFCLKTNTPFFLLCVLICKCR